MMEWLDRTKGLSVSSYHGRAGRETDFDTANAANLTASTRPFIDHG